MTARSLVCTGSGFEVRAEAVPAPKPGEVVVRVHATSVNPIDVKRSRGYGRRLLSVRGAGSLPRVLGNDFAGIVDAVGAGVSGFRTGDRVFGVVPTGPRGAHASHVAVDRRWVRSAPPDATFDSLAVLPYSFGTTWRAIHGAGLTRHSAPGRRVLILGAGGGLGRLAIALLSSLRAEVWGIARNRDRDACVLLGAREIVDRDDPWDRAFAHSFDATLNFGSWQEDARLCSCLGRDALGHATTVHPLVQTLDRRGWAAGAIACLHEWRRALTRVRRHAPRARYTWTLFFPDDAALDALDPLRPALPIGIRCSFDDAAAAFSHVADGRSGRAILVSDDDGLARIQRGS